MLVESLYKRPVLAAAFWLVAQRRKFLRDEEIVDRIGIGAGAAQSDHVPDVVHRGAGHRKQDGADLRRAIRLAPRRAIGLDDADMGAEPARLPRAGGEIPARAGFVAARNRLHFMIDRAPGQNAGRDVEDFVGGIGIEIGRGHGADAALAKAPRGRGIRLGDLFLHLHESFQRSLGAAKTLRQQRAIKPVLDQRLGHRRRQPPRPLDLVGFARDQGRQRACTLDEVEAGMLTHAFLAFFLGLFLCLAAMVTHPPPSIKAADVSRRRPPQVERRLRRPLGRREAQRHGDGGDADGERADIEPVVGVEGVEHPSAGERAQAPCRGWRRRRPRRTCCP